MKNNMLCALTLSAAGLITECNCPNICHWCNGGKQRWHAAYNIPLIRSKNPLVSGSATA